MSMAGSGGGERDQLKSAKIAVLKLINEHKETLFGKLSETLTREAKESKWAEVADHAHALGAFPWHRSWDYLKDTTWQNWRKRFVEKREKKEKYDKAGLGSKVVYDEADLLIMEILDSLGGRNPSASAPMQGSFNNYPVTDASIRDISDMLEIEFDVKAEGTDTVDGGMYHTNENHAGLMGDGEISSNYSTANAEGDFQDDIHGRYESLQSQSDYNPGEDNDTSRISNDNSQQPKIVSTSSLSAMSRAAALRKSAFSSIRSGMHGRKRPASFMTNSTGLHARSLERELTDLKCRKIRAELELLQRETYKKDLEILQLERSLGLPASNITKKFYRFNRTHPSIVSNSLPK